MRLGRVLKRCFHSQSLPSMSNQSKVLSVPSALYLSHSHVLLISLQATGQPSKTHRGKDIPTSVPRRAGTAAAVTAELYLWSVTKLLLQCLLQAQHRDELRGRTEPDSLSNWCHRSISPARTERLFSMHGWQNLLNHRCVEQTQGLPKQEFLPYYLPEQWGSHSGRESSGLSTTINHQGLEFTIQL